MTINTILSVKSLYNKQKEKTFLFYFIKVIFRCNILLNKDLATTKNCFAYS